MARAFVVPLRNDLAGMNLQITDLGSDPQNFYIRWFSKDAAVHTAALAVTAAEDSDGDLANDCHATQAENFGLLAYLRDRVHGDPAGNDDRLTPAQALNVANDIYAAALAGTNLTLAVINGFLEARVAVGTDLTGVTAGSTSFGTVEEILRILAGEVYRVPDNTIVADQNANFIALAARDVLVAAAALAGNTYFSSGAFVARGAAGFRDVPVLVRTGALNLSTAEGKLFGFQTARAILNPDFAYTAAAVTQFRPRAVDITAANLPATGLLAPVSVYSNMGVAL